MTKKTQEYRKQLAELFVHALEEQELNWQKGWNGKAFLPQNAVTEKAYRGLNRFYLAMIAKDRGYQESRWATFHQIQEHGWKLEHAKGQGVQVEYWFPYDTEEKQGLSWSEFRNRSEEFGERYQLRAVYSYVFNGDLIQGLPELQIAQNDTMPDELIGVISRNMQVEMLHDGGNQAFYNQQQDQIHLPVPECFESDYAYNATALHELAHATGAPHRLKRELAGYFGSESYAYEELVAEITASFFAVHLAVEPGQMQIENHKAYVQSWIRAIREKPERLVKAIQQAEKAATYLEYHAGLVDQKEYLRCETTTVEVEEMEGKSYMGIRKDIQEIQNMQHQIQGNTVYMKKFMEDNHIPLLQKNFEKESVPKFGTEKGRQR